MQIKYTVQGALILLTMGAFLLTLLSSFRKKSTATSLLWLAGFFCALASVSWRGIHTGHPPFQNLFEVFLCLAVFLYPATWLTRKTSGIDTTRSDAVLGLIFLFPAAFVFSESVRRLPPALQSPLFVPHVLSYMAGYVMLARAAVLAAPLWRKSRKSEHSAAFRAAHCAAAIGFFLITVGLILGSVWGNQAWGNYWQWDPKEMWSLATWLIYVAFFHEAARGSLARRPWILAALLTLGFIFIILTLTWINLSKLFPGMHAYA